MSGKVTIMVNGKKVKPWQPVGKKFVKIILWKNQKIKCYFWISDDEIPEERRHIVYSVFGKRIKNDQVDFAYQIKGDKNNKVFCLADVSVLGKWLNSNKEDFQKNVPASHVRSKIKAAFYQFLGEQGLLQKGVDKGMSSNVIINELTKRIDRALQTKELRFLNPFSNPKMHFTVVRDENGDLIVSPTEGLQKGKGTKGSDGRGEGIAIAGDSDGKSVVRDENGIETGKEKQQKSRGIALIIEEYPDDPREGWVDLENKGVVYNSGHSFNKQFYDKNTFDYNLTRVVISSLIKFRNDQVNMDAKTTLEYMEKIFHDVWQ